MVTSVCVERRQIDEEKFQVALERKLNYSKEQLAFPVRNTSETIKDPIPRALFRWGKAFLCDGWLKYAGVLYLLESE